ncbi:MAG: DUF1569 domain-containing protein [Planctomycetaceae bacterium]|nr:DUF1569 domain-containing protein [Planctomycetaceae bacterium]
MSQTERRPLKFESLQEAVTDAENLLTNGYEKAGNWDLAQCSHHLALWMSYPIEGFPKMGFPMNFIAWMMRHTIGPRWIGKIIDSGNWPTNSPTDQRTVATPGGNDAEAVAELKAAVDQLLKHDGPLHPSPAFGMMEKERLIELHKSHTAHHLGFLIPKS